MKFQTAHRAKKNARLIFRSIFLDQVFRCPTGRNALKRLAATEIDAIRNRRDLVAEDGFEFQVRLADFGIIIIGALYDNLMFRMICWSSSHRVGLHIFHIIKLNKLEESDK